MKRIITPMALVAFTLSILAQSPDLMTYQAVIRNSENKLVANQAVAVQISIMQGTPNGAPLYIEVHTLNTNANGLISLEIGAGVTGDDFSLIDWSSGSFFLKTETDPEGGSNYTISSTTQLLSVPFSKYADVAGNVFSGNYADLSGVPVNVGAFTNDVGYLTNITGSETAFNSWDKNVTDDFSGNYGDLSGAPMNVSAFTNDAGYLTTLTGSETAFNSWDKDVTDDFTGNYGDLSGAPTNVSAFTNDAGYLTTLTGSESVFNGWDKNVADDFSGNYGDLSGAPSNVSAFNNDAGYLTSDLWSQNGNDIYYTGGYTGIGTTTPNYPLTISSATDDSFVQFLNSATGTTIHDGFIVGAFSTGDAVIYNNEFDSNIHFGSHGAFHLTISGIGNVGINDTDPDHRLVVRGDTKLGDDGFVFNELREITGTTQGSFFVEVTLPFGYNETNTRVLSLEINYNSDRWVGLGYNHTNPPTEVYNISYLINGTSLFIYYPPVSTLQHRLYRVLIMQAAP